MTPGAPLPIAVRDWDDWEPDLTPRTVSVSATVLNQIMEIEHANQAGYVHGGVILRLVDTAASVAAIEHARRRVVTAAIDEMSFSPPSSSATSSPSGLPSTTSTAAPWRWG